MSPRKRNRKLWKEEEQDTHTVCEMRTEELPSSEEPLWFLWLPFQSHPQM
ncbi:hypothetical protein RJ641_024167 [Dillenia turbinata]|uniref:Uncharacterized protein n=1 Tax=Dillenia turbinata TaxID=194707 RepID=A0AAN8YR19_9MAGN